MPRAILICLVAVLALAAPAAAQPKVIDNEKLPPGALARLGSTKFRVGFGIGAMRYLPDGKNILTGFISDYGGLRLRLVGADTGASLLQWQRAATIDSIAGPRLGDELPPLSFCWCISPDGRLFAEAENVLNKQFGTVEIRVIATGKVVFRHQEKGVFLKLQFSPNGKQVVALHQEDMLPRSIHSWDISTGKEVVSWPTPKAVEKLPGKGPDDFTFAANGKALAVFSKGWGDEGVIQVFDWPSMTNRRRMKGNPKLTKPVPAGEDRVSEEAMLALSPDGKRIAFMGQGEVVVWNTDTGKKIDKWSAPKGPVAALAFSPDGNHLGIASEGEFALRPVSDGKPLATIKDARAFLFSPNGEPVAVLDMQWLRLLGTKTGKELWKARRLTGDGGYQNLSFNSMSANYIQAQQGLGWPLAFSPDGKLLALLEFIGVIRRWDAATGKELPLGDENLYPLGDLAFAPNGKVLAALHTDRVVLWDVPGRKRLRDLHVSTDALTADILTFGSGGMVVFSSDGRYLAALWWGGPLVVWDMATGKQLWQQLADKSGLTDMIFGPGDRSLICGYTSGDVIWWDASTGKMKRKTRLKNRLKGGLSPDTEIPIRIRLVVGARMAMVDGQLFELSTGLPRAPAPPENSPIRDLDALSANGKLGVSASFFTIFPPGPALLDFPSGSFVRHVGEGVQGSQTLSPNGKFLVSVDRAGPHLSHVPTGCHMDFFPGRVEADTLRSAAAFSPDGKMLAIGTEEGTILLWKMPEVTKDPWPAPGPAASWKAPPPATLLLPKADPGAKLPADALLSLPVLPAGKKSELKSALLALSADNRLLAVSTLSGVVLWDVPKRKQLHSFQTLAGDKNLTASTIALNADGKLLAAGHVNGKVVLWNSQSGKVVHELENHTRAITSLDFSGDGKELRSADAEGGTTWWDPASGNKLRSTSGVVEKHKVAAPWLVPGPGLTALSPDGKSLAVVDKDGVQMLDTATGKSLWHISAKDAQLQEAYHVGLAFSPDGNYLLYSTWGVHMVAANSGKLVRHLTWMRDVRSVAFSGDGKHIAVGGSKGLELWDAANGNKLAQRRDTKHEVLAVAFSPDGQYLVTVSDDTTILLWDLAALGTKPALPPMSDEQITKLWQKVGSPNAETAYDAMLKLSQYPKQTVALLKAELKPVAAADAKALAQWVAELGDESFVVRSKAFASLEKAGDLAEPALVAALKKPVTVEHHLRITKLLTPIVEESPPLPQIKQLRAIELLEMIGTPEAAAVLAELAKGAPASRLTQEAQASVKRLQIGDASP